MSGRATANDVAALAGVSQPTVSRALRDDPRIALATRIRVREAAEALAYVPSRRGRILAAGSTGQVAIVISDLANPFFSEAIQHLTSALYEADLRPVVHTDVPDNPVVPERLLDGLVDAAILVNTTLDSSLARFLAGRGLPVVQFNRTSFGEASDACVSDQEMGARQVAKLLAELGHRRVAALFGDSRASTGVARESGFRAGLDEAGIELPDDMVRYGAFTTAAGEEGLDDLLATGARPTALFCANDVIALGALNTCKERAIAVPADMTVIGFDDIALASWKVFRLTTVHQDLATMSKATVTLLRERMAEPDLPFRRVGVGVQLMLRDSHGPVPASS